MEETKILSKKKKLELKRKERWCVKYPGNNSHRRPTLIWGCCAKRWRTPSGAEQVGGAAWLAEGRARSRPGPRCWPPARAPCRLCPAAGRRGSPSALSPVAAWLPEHDHDVRKHGTVKHQISDAISISPQYLLHGALTFSSKNLLWCEMCECD
jgi:hypothetical protein